MTSLLDLSSPDLRNGSSSDRGDDAVAAAHHDLTPKDESASIYRRSLPFKKRECKVRSGDFSYKKYHRAGITEDTVVKSGRKRGKGKSRKSTQVQGIANKSGRWSLDEQKEFLRGLKKYGKGNWSKISKSIPTRDCTQVKTHAQVVLKRMNSGIDVFAALNESRPNHLTKSENKSRSHTDDADSDVGNRNGKSKCGSPTTLVETSNGAEESWRNFYSPLQGDDISFPTNLDAHHPAASKSTHTPSYMPLPKNLGGNSPFAPMPLLHPTPFLRESTPRSLPPMENYLPENAMPSKTVTNTSVYTAATAATHNAPFSFTATNQHSPNPDTMEEMEDLSSVAKILVEMSTPTNQMMVPDQGIPTTNLKTPKNDQLARKSASVISGGSRTSFHAQVHIGNQHKSSSPPFHIVPI